MLADLVLTFGSLVLYFSAGLAAVILVAILGCVTYCTASYLRHTRLTNTRHP